jgi:hypothetical protein
LTASTALPRQSVQRGSRAPLGATTRDRSKWSRGARRVTSGEPWPDQTRWATWRRHSYADGGARFARRVSSRPRSWQPG